MVCSNPACKLAGIDQPPGNFLPRHKKCKTCRHDVEKAWREKNRESIKAMRKHIPDDDPEDDLVPSRFGEAGWARITR